MLTYSPQFHTCQPDPPGWWWKFWWSSPSSCSGRNGWRRSCGPGWEREHSNQFYYYKCTAHHLADLMQWIAANRLFHNKDHLLVNQSLQTKCLFASDLWPLWSWLWVFLIARYISRCQNLAKDQGRARVLKLLQSKFWLERCGWLKIWRKSKLRPKYCREIQTR